MYVIYPSFNKLKDSVAFLRKHPFLLLYSNRYCHLFFIARTDIAGVDSSPGAANRPPDIREKMSNPRGYAR